VGGAATRILVGGIGRRRDAVEAHELVDDELAHLGLSLVYSVCSCSDRALPRNSSVWRGGLLPRNAEESELHPVRGRNAHVAIAPRRLDRRSQLRSALRDEPLGSRIGILDFEGDPLGAGRAPSDLDRIDRGRLRLVERLERSAVRTEKEPATTVIFEEAELLEPQGVALEGHGGIEVV